MADAPPEGVASRIVAYRAVRRVHTTGAWSPRAVDSALKGRGARLDARDRAFAANLAYETLRWEGTLDFALAQVLTRPLAAVQPEVLDVLRIGAWQLLYGGTPDRSAVGTSVDVARREIGPQATGFVNGVLRGLSRQRAGLPWPPEETDEGLGLALGYPAWMVTEARRTFGDRAREVLAAGNAAPGLTLRAVAPDARDEAGATRVRDALVDELRRLGLDAAPGALAGEAVRVPGADPAALAAVTEGRATPQDEASMVVVRALERAAGGLRGARVVDLCAAPGGKATHLAALGADTIAFDLRPARARLVAEAAAGLGAAVRVAAADGRRPPLLPGSVDAVLLDAPCTGLGVVRRRPELRWRRNPGDPARLAVLQAELASAAVTLLRPGGTLLYSVCTWTRAETAGIVEVLTAAEGDRLDRLPLEGWPGRTGSGLQLDPARDGTDAMFLGGFRRRSGAVPSPGGG